MWKNWWSFFSQKRKSKWMQMQQCAKKKKIYNKNRTNLRKWEIHSDKRTNITDQCTSKHQRTMHMFKIKFISFVFVKKFKKSNRGCKIWIISKSRSMENVSQNCSIISNVALKLSNSRISSNGRKREKSMEHRTFRQFFEIFDCQQDMIGKSCGQVVTSNFLQMWII